MQNPSDVYSPVEHAPDTITPMSETDPHVGDLFETPDTPIRRLQNTVHMAIAEINRLRAENRLLQGQLHELESSTQTSTDILGHGSPEEIKAQIESFIDTIDRVLAEHKTSPSTLPENG